MQPPHPGVPPDRRRLGLAAATGAVVIWGAISVIVKGIDGIGGVGIATYRLVFGAVLLSIVHLANQGRIDRALLRACIPGGVAIAADLLLFFSALRETSVANATVIGALQPVLLLPVGVRLFGERISRSTVVFSVIAVGGTAVVILGASGVPEWSLRGDLLACGALLSWTAYFITSKQARRSLGAIEYFTGITIVAAAIAVPFAAATGTDLSPAGPRDWGSILVITVFSGGIGHVLLNWSHAHVPLQTVSVLTLLVPVIAIAGAVLFLGETLAVVQLIGIIVVLGALIEVVRRTSAPEPITTGEPTDVAP